jgi:hypothetical protein
MMLRRISGPKRKEEAGCWRRMHNKESHNLYALQNIIRVIKSRMRWAGHVEHMEEMRNAYSILVGRPDRKKPLGRSKHRWEDNSRMDVMEIVWKCVDWIHVAQDRDQ